MSSSPSSSATTSQIPALAPSDIAHAISLIQAAYAPTAASDLPALQSLQSALLAMQRTPAAWGLIVPLLAHEDVNVQFFGAHTAHAKISRGEMAALPAEEQAALRDALVGLAGVRRGRVVRRKLYGALVALALRLVPTTGGGPSAWEGWVGGTVARLVEAGAPSGHVHEFLAGAAEDVGAANLLPQAKIQLDASLRAAAPLVLQSIAAVLASPPPQNQNSSQNSSENTDAADALPSALACLVAWLPNRLLPDADVATLVPPLIALLPSPPSPPSPSGASSQSLDATDDKASTAAASALTELLARPPAAWSPAVLLEPLMLWVGRAFPEFTLHAQGYPPQPHSNYTSTSAQPNYALPPLTKTRTPQLRRHAKLLVALAEAGVEWVAEHVVDYSLVSFNSNAAYAGQMGGAIQGGETVARATLAQTLLRVVLALTAVDPGGRGCGSRFFPFVVHSSFGGARRTPPPARRGLSATEDDEDDDEDEDQPSGAPLYFWYLLQEALWEVPAANPHLFPSTSSSTSFPHPSSSSYPSSPTEMDPDDPDLFRARSGGTPWTPGVVRSGSYAFASSPIVSPMGAPPFAHSGSFGFPSSSSSSSAFAAEHPFAAGEDEREREMEREKRETEEEMTAEKARTAHARAAYVALVRILRGKVVCGRGRGWGRDRLERFAVYRRDVGDTLVNAYFILRDDLLVFLVAEAEAAAKGVERVRGMWETLEAPLHCLRAVHEALDLDSISTSATSTEHEGRGLAALGRLFGGEVWGRLPGALPASAAHNPTTTTMHNQGHNGANGQGGQEGEALAVQRLRRTALGLVDTYASYFTTRAPDALLPPLQYVLGALADPDPGICLAAALALRSLCDANRRALASKIGAFAEVHAGLGGVPDSEKGKVLQSIASVIQALPPAEAVAPVEAMVGPILQRLGTALGAVGAHPEAARLAAILQLEVLAGVAKGLTRTADPMAFDEEDGGGAEADAVRAAREDPRTGALRAALFDAIAQVAELWSADAEVGQALSELFKAITALPADVTLLSLPAGPLLGVVCRAAGRRLNGVWLALAAILIQQLNPPPLILTLKSGPSEEAEACVREAVGGLVTAALGLLGAPGGMVENPDIVQEFFACMDRVAQDFTAAFCALPDGAFDALMQCAISALALQERYSLVAAATFLVRHPHPPRCALRPDSPEQLQLLQAHLIRTHGRAIMRALLAALVSRWDERAVGEAEGEMREGRHRERRAWVGRGRGVCGGLLPVQGGQEAKERFVKTVVSSRSVKKTKEAANQFTIVAWGLEGSAFGYSSASSV
ncbi:hypothetical protein B0H13DRAFT_2324463 [Mycena leptocephala]|nr:hypothetical protein B0H13DRAFT_2324463 [Mycena leptocephala]